MSVKEPVYLIDGSAYIYRAYHAIAALSNTQGVPTNAVYGFTNTLLRVLREKNPQYVAIAFDAKGPTFRHQFYPAYKANRPPMPDDLVPQIPYIRRIVRAYSLPVLEKTGVEADDLIASAATLLAKQGRPVIIVSGDKDLLQLVSETISFWEPMKDVILTTEQVHEKYKVPPAKLLDLFALMGDKSDNIPGVVGIGLKTAEKLINEFGSLEGIYEHTDDLKQLKLKENLLQHRQDAFLSRKLIRLLDDIPIPAAIDEYRPGRPDHDVLKTIFLELNFHRLLKSEIPAAAMETEGFQLVSTRRQLKSLSKQWTKASLLAIDTETSSLDPLEADLAGISLCTDSNNAYYIGVGHRHEDGSLQEGQLDKTEVLEILRPLLEDANLPKVGHNLKYDYEILCQQGIKTTGPLWDTMIASYLLNPARRSHGLDDLCREFLDLQLTSFTKVTKGDKRPESFVYVTLPEAKDYSCEDVQAAYRLWEIFREKLHQLGLWQLFAEMEIVLVPILAGMELQGIAVDPDLLARLSEEFQQKLKDLETEIYRQAGEEFNINSPAQLGEILFEKLNLPHSRKTKTGYSTDISVLEKLAYHELVQAVISHRTLSKLQSTYIEKLSSLVHPKTGRIHTSFNQTVTATGRLSSSNPNLQNIPIRTEEGQRIRQAFIPAPGHLFVAGDYSQIDLRVLAHYSKDPALQEAFHSGQDIHSRTAAEIFFISPMLITPQMRRVAKTINFGIIYGMSSFGLASQLHISRNEAQTFIDRYFAHYAGVKQFMAEIVEQARKSGYVTTLFNRRRPLPEINSRNRTRREFAERTAINTPIQGTAADIIKLAMIKVDQMLRQQKPQAKMLLQIHDELVFEVKSREAATVGPLIKEAMESVVKLDVPLLVNMASGPNLAEV
jgi:DNA polymerase-1